MRHFVPLFLSLLTVSTALIEAPTHRRLELVISLCRHGDRSPLYSFPTDNFALKDWPEGVGGLTSLGANAHYKLGLRLRKHYIEKLDFLFPWYDRRQVYVLSSDVDRTLMSAYSQMFGMFPPDSAHPTDVGLRFGLAAPKARDIGLPYRSQPVAIRSVPREDDGMLLPGGNCPRHVRLQDEKRRSNRWWRKQRQEYALGHLLQHATGSLTPILLGDIPHVADTWRVHSDHRIPLPQDGSTLLYRASFVSEWVANFTNSGTEARRLRAGLLLNEVSKRARLARDARLGTVPVTHIHLHNKFVLLSAHDTTLAAVLAALRIFNGRNPPYNSTIIWEVHSNVHDERDVTVRLLYNDQAIRIPGCRNEIFCPLEDYLHATRRYTVESRAMRRRECMTGLARMGADIRSLFFSEPLDADDIGSIRGPHIIPIMIAFLLMVGAGAFAAKTVNRRYEAIPRTVHLQLGISEEESRQAEQRVFRSFEPPVRASSSSVMIG